MTRACHRPDDRLEGVGKCALGLYTRPLCGANDQRLARDSSLGQAGLCHGGGTEPFDGLGAHSNRVDPDCDGSPETPSTAKYLGSRQWSVGPAPLSEGHKI